MTTKRLGTLSEGDALLDFVGPLGVASHLDGYKKVENPKSRRPEVILQLSKNKRLKAEFLRTQAHHDKLIKLKDLFLEMFPTDTKH